MVTDTAMDTYEQGKKITVKAEVMKAEAKEHFGQCKELMAAISDFFGSPVIGPVVFWFLHRIVALFTVSFFLYTLVAAVPTFSEKVTFAEVEYLAEYQLPDVYTCLDGETMKMFISKEKQSTKKTVMQFRSGVSSDTRCGFFNMAFFNLKTGEDDEGECPMKDLKYGSNWDMSTAPEMAVFDGRLNFDAWRPSSFTDEIEAPGPDDTAGFLAGLLPKATVEIIKDDGTEATVTVPAYCLRNIARVGAKSHYETNQDLALGMSTRILPPDLVSPQLDLTTNRPSRLLTPCALLFVCAPLMLAALLTAVP